MLCDADARFLDRVENGYTVVAVIMMSLLLQLVVFPSTKVSNEWDESQLQFCVVVT